MGPGEQGQGEGGKGSGHGMRLRNKDRRKHELRFGPLFCACGFPRARSAIAVRLLLSFLSILPLVLLLLFFLSLTHAP